MLTEQVDRVARYQFWRQGSAAIAYMLTATFSKEAIHEAARKLGMLHKDTLVLDSEDEIAVIMDFCLHDVRERGMTAIERRLAEVPPTVAAEEMVILQGLRSARYSLFLVEATERGAGLHLRDLLRDDKIFVIDINLSNTASEGLVLAGRIVTYDGVSMLTGASLPMAQVPAPGRDLFLRQFASQFKAIADEARSPQQRSEFVALLIRALRKVGASAHVRYADPGEKIKPRPKAKDVHSGWAASRSPKKPRVGLNDRCPCGSGRKYKNCCASQR